jgi:hypothetical protein
MVTVEGEDFLYILCISATHRWPSPFSPFATTAYMYYEYRCRNIDI